MPPKKNIKNTTQKQRQKKAKQQQQQQQGQNVKININLSGNKPTRRRKPGGKQPPKQPPKPPPQLPIQPQYVPMHIVQQPPTYFTPPVSSSSSIPISTPGSAISSIIPPLPPTSTLRGIPPPIISTFSTIGPITNMTAPSIELDTFSNFTPSQNVVSNLIAFRDLDEPMASSFNDYTGIFADVNDWVQESIDDYDRSFSTRFTDNETQTDRPLLNYAETQTDRYATSFNNVGTQFDGFLPQQPDLQSSISNAINTSEIIPPPQPPPPPRRAVSPPLIPKEFMTPTQDIQQSGVQRIVDLTQENLQLLGGITQSKEYAPSEISDMTEGTSMSINTDITNLIQNAAKKRAENQRSIDDYLVETKKEKKNEDKGIYGDLSKEIEKRRQYISPTEPEIDESNEWEDEEPTYFTKPQPKSQIKFDQDEEDEEEEPAYSTKPQPPPEEKQPERKPIEQEKKRKPGSGRPKGSGNRTELEKEYENNKKQIKADIRTNKQKLNSLNRFGLDYDEDGKTSEDYEQLIEDGKNQLTFLDELINEEKESRVSSLKPIAEGNEDEEDDEDF